MLRLISSSRVPLRQQLLKNVHCDFTKRNLPITTVSFTRDITSFYSNDKFLNRNDKKIVFNQSNAVRFVHKGIYVRSSSKPSSKPPSESSAGDSSKPPSGNDNSDDGKYGPRYTDDEIDGEDDDEEVVGKSPEEDLDFLKNLPLLNYVPSEFRKVPIIAVSFPVFPKFMKVFEVKLQCIRTISEFKKKN